MMVLFSNSDLRIVKSSKDCQVTGYNMPLLCLPICSVLARDCLKEGGYIPCHFTILCNALHSLRRVEKKTGGGGG